MQGILLEARQDGRIKEGESGFISIYEVVNVVSSIQELVYGLKIKMSTKGKADIRFAFCQFSII